MNVAQYLLDKLYERGVRHMFGVPGDYSLAFLNEVMDHSGLDWVGNANELNAAYAADGYSRMVGVSAISVTYGVGELSAMNGVAGAYAEHVPTVVIVSVPTREQIDRETVVHHGLGDGDWAHFVRAYSEVTVAQAVLSPENAMTEIDRVLDAMERERRPVYIGIPADIPGVEVGSRQAVEIAHASGSTEPLRRAFKAAVDDLVARTRRAVFVVGHEAARFGVSESLQELAQVTGIPVAVTAMGKGAIDEQAVRWLGVYNGAASDDDVRPMVEGAELVLRIGMTQSDAETAGFTAAFEQSRLVDIRPGCSSVADQRFEGLQLGESLALLREVLTAHGGWDTTLPRRSHTQPAPVGAEAPITQDELWRLVADSLRPGDLVLTDSGTAGWGMLGQDLPSGVGYQTQTHWGSIGMSLPAALGAALAARERRVVLIIGDGALQLTVQEIATVARYHVPLSIIVIANDGFTIERVIDGPTAAYNDIHLWDHLAVVRALANEDVPGVSVNTMGELVDALTEFGERGRQFQVLEVRTGRMDVPLRLRRFSDVLLGRTKAIA